MSPYDNRWYKKNIEYDVDFSTAMRLKRHDDFYVDFPYHKNPYDPSIWKDHRQATFVSDIDASSGWGNVGTNLIRYSPKEQFSLIGKLWDVRDPSVVAAMRREINPNSAAIWHEQPKAAWMLSPFSRNIAIVPFETTRVPPSWVPRLNSMDAVFVPCEQNVQMMRDSGVTVPLEVIHWGVGRDMLVPVIRTPRDDVFTFGTMGALSIRKGTNILVKAFELAFPTEQDVQLICKTSNRGYPFMTNDKRVRVQVGPVPHSELLEDFFSKVDCFVFPTLGEGFGFPPLEAMATGIPAIVTGWSGPMEYMTPEVGWTIDYSMDEAKEFSDKVYREPCGEWAIPDMKHLIHLMRYAYEHRNEVREKGAAAAQYVREKWTWEKQIHLFHEALDKHL